MKDRELIKTVAAKPSTLKDVALRAGVSKVAASVVLNGSRSNAEVSEGTRRRILQVAAELRYHPNAVARSLTRRHTNIVGLYVGYGYMDAHNAFFAEIISGLQRGCDLHQKDLLLHGTFRGRSIDEIYGEFLSGKEDGLAIIVPPSSPLVAKLAASHLPVVTLVDAEPDLPSIVVDDANGARLIALHLHERGHRRVMYCVQATPHTSVQRRLAAFQEICAALGIEVEVVHSAQDVMDPGRMLPTETRERLRDTPRDQRPTAIACATDLMALRVLADLESIGLRVPEDVALTGFDGFRSPIHSAVRLTSIRVPWVEVAEASVTALVHLIEGREVPRETVLPVTFQPGDTT